MILGIDPGVDTGWAIVDEKAALQSCGLGYIPDDLAQRAFSLVIIEKPQIYPNTGVKQANDLIGLATMVGRYSERFRQNPISLVLPHTWKGSVPKEIHNRRVLSKLDKVELYLLNAVKCPKSKQHNVIDAVGLAKWGAKQLASGIYTVTMLPIR